MNKIIHPIEPEELMAYLDGELTTDRATAAAAHLGECAECQNLVAELRSVSQNLKTWKVEAAGVSDVISSRKCAHRKAAGIAKCLSCPQADVAGDFEPALANSRVGGNGGGRLLACVQHGQIAGPAPSA